MHPAPRKKSPRAPSLPLDEALDRALKAYDRDRLHPMPTDLVAQHIGYRSANNGAALSALASLRYYGLLERPKDGMLAVTKDVEAFRFAPNEDLRRSLLARFLRQPPLFDSLLEKYESGLPSDSNLKDELILRGFALAAAEAVLVAFKRSVEFAGFYEAQSDSALGETGGLTQVRLGEIADEPASQVVQPERSALPFEQQSSNAPQVPAVAQYESVRQHGEFDRIPVRLPGGRRAWLLIPTPFYFGDKARLKAQIDLLLTEDEDD